MIVFDHVSKVYPNGTVGLDDVCLRIDDGEFVAIIGRSGAGKSTLLRAVNRMHQITSGTLMVNGTDVTGLSGKRLRQFRRGIGMVFQSFNLVTRTSVIKNVLAACVPDMPFWRVLLGAFRKEDKIKALESLDKVGILDKAYMRADQLSGGQQQRVAARPAGSASGRRDRHVSGSVQPARKRTRGKPSYRAGAAADPDHRISACRTPASDRG